MQIARTFTTAVALALAACTEPNDDPLRLVLTVDRSTVVAHDSVKLSLELINQSTRTVRTTSPESYGFCQHAFGVSDALGREVSVLSGLCIAALIANPLIDLLPGQSFSITDYWHPGSSTMDGHVINPGQYRLFGRVYGDAEAITSPAKLITVLP